MKPFTEDHILQYVVLIFPFVVEYYHHINFVGLGKKDSLEFRIT